MRKPTVLLVCLIALSGCTHRIGDFTVASTKNIDLKNTKHVVDDRERLSGKDTAHIVLGIPTGYPNIEEAMDNAIERRFAAVGLSNVTVKRSFWVIPGIYGQDSFEVEGSPIYEPD